MGDKQRNTLALDRDPSAQQPFETRAAHYRYLVWRDLPDDQRSYDNAAAALGVSASRLRAIAAENVWEQRLQHHREACRRAADWDIRTNRAKQAERLADLQLRLALRAGNTLDRRLEHDSDEVQTRDMVRLLDVASHRFADLLGLGKPQVSVTTVAASGASAGHTVTAADVDALTEDQAELLALEAAAEVLRRREQLT